MMDRKNSTRAIMIRERKQAEKKEGLITGKLLKTIESAIRAMTMIIEITDSYTAGHQRRVSQLACAIAERLGLSRTQIDALRLAGLVHDIGKIRIPVEILTHPDGLSRAEFAIIKMHPLVGHDILKIIESTGKIAQIVRQHHERMDGSGYPEGVSGENIVLEARILAVADVVEAMISHRPYRPAHSLDKALGEISQKKGILYDAEVVDACFELFAKKEFRFEEKYIGINFT